MATFIHVFLKPCRKVDNAQLGVRKIHEFLQPWAAAALTCDNFETRSRDLTHSTFDRSTYLSGSLVNKEDSQCQQDLRLKCSAWKDLVPSPKFQVLGDPSYHSF